MFEYGGNGEIRTHGPFRIDSFQDCCNKPDSATLPKSTILKHTTSTDKLLMLGTGRGPCLANVFQYGRGTWNRTKTSGVKDRCTAIMRYPNCNLFVKERYYLLLRFQSTEAILHDPQTKATTFFSFQTKTPRFFRSWGFCLEW